MKQDESTRGPPASLLRKNTSEDMGLSMNQNTGQGQRKDAFKFLVFSDVMGDGVSTLDRNYNEISNFDELNEKMQSYLEDYNSVSKKPLHLILFTDAINHILRICRIMRFSQGNGLLIGLGGSGRQSLTKIASFICDYELNEFEVTKNYSKELWKEDMGKFIKNIGVNGKNFVLCLDQAQLKYPFILEDINNLLNTGEIPNLFPPDEVPQIVESLRAIAKRESRFDSGGDKKEDLT